MATEVNTQTQTVVTLRPPPAAQDVRLNFFSKLGFDSPPQQQQSASAAYTNSAPYPRSQFGNSNGMSHPPSGCYIDEHNTTWAQRIQNVNTFQEELKWDPHDEELYGKPMAAEAAKSTTDDTEMQNDVLKKKKKKKKKKSLSFHETVEVVPIPMRSEYSNRVKARLWSNAMEIQENAARNSLEFAHEGWNWRNVLEDEHMYVCVTTGELVHPSHYQMYESHGFR